MRRFRFVLQGPPVEATASLARLVFSTLVVCIRRALFGPGRAGWTLNFEIATDFFRGQAHRAFHIAGCGRGIVAARRMIDTLVFRTPDLDCVRIVPEGTAPLPGRWFMSGRAGPVSLHLHGGGYVFSPANTDNLVAALTRAAGGQTFVPDYRLAPEHPFPSQLDDALRSYEWLLERNGPGSNIVLTGDSAGGHLALALLLTLCEKGLPLPIATIAISPWTDLGNGGASMHANAPSDWMTAEMSDRMATWAVADRGREHPLLRLQNADLSVLRGVLVHAGDAEIFLDMVQDFCERAIKAGADLVYESWPDMNHNFHGFGDLVPQSRQALDGIATYLSTRISEVAQHRQPAVSAIPAAGREPQAAGSRPTTATGSGEVPSP